jgi:hypothetical protein
MQRNNVGEWHEEIRICKTRRLRSGPARLGVDGSGGWGAVGFGLVGSGLVRRLRSGAVCRDRERRCQARRLGSDW